MQMFRLAALKAELALARLTGDSARIGAAVRAIDAIERHRCPCCQASRPPVGTRDGKAVCAWCVVPNQERK